MPDDLATTIGAVVQRLVSLAMGDAELQAGLRQLAEQFLKQTAPPTTAVGEMAAGQHPAVEAVVPQEVPILAPSRRQHMSRYPRSPALRCQEGGCSEWVLPMPTCN